MGYVNKYITLGGVAGAKVNRITQHDVKNPSGRYQYVHGKENRGKNHIRVQRQMFRLRPGKAFGFSTPKTAAGVPRCSKVLS